MNATDLCLIVDNDRQHLACWLNAARHNIALHGEFTAEHAEQYAEAACNIATPFTGRFLADVARLVFARIDWQEVADHYNVMVGEGVTVPAEETRG